MASGYEVYFHVFRLTGQESCIIVIRPLFTLAAYPFLPYVCCAGLSEGPSGSYTSLCINGNQVFARRINWSGAGISFYKHNVYDFIRFKYDLSSSDQGYTSGNFPKYEILWERENTDGCPYCHIQFCI